MIIKFTKNISASIAPIFVLVVTPILLSVGVAVDYSNLSKVDSKIHNTLDAAILAGAHENNLAEAQVVINQHFAAVFPDVPAPIVTFKEMSENYEISASVETYVDNTFMGLFGHTRTKVTNYSEAVAPKKLSKVWFRAISASGWWDKTVSLMVRQVGANEDVEMVRIEYTSPQWSTGIFTVSPRDWVDLGQYEYAYLLFKVDPKSKDFRKYCGKCPTDIRSDDPDWSQRLSIDGKQMPANTPVDIFTAIKCGSSRQSWEDGGGGKPDIHFDVDGLCDAIDADKIRLTK